MQLKICLNKESIKNILLLAFVKVTFSYIYTTTIYPVYSYYGFRNDFSALRAIISWLVFIPLALSYVTLSKQNDLSKQIVTLFLTASFLPCLVLYEYMDAPYFGMLCIYYLSMVLASYLIHFRFASSESRARLPSEIPIKIISVILSAVVIYVWARYADFRVQLDFTSVYEARAAAREFQIPGIIRSLRSIARGVIPLIAIYRLYQKKYVSTAFYIFVEFIQFCIDGTKSTVFTLVLGLAAYFLIKKGKTFITYIPHGLSIINILAILETKLFGTTFISLTVIRRTFFIPALLNYDFYEYFSVNGFDFYRQSILNRILGKSAYSLTLAQEIGLKYFGRSNYNANNGLFADAYANLGIVGVILMPIIIVVFFEVLRNAAGDIPPEVWAICSISAYFTFTGSSFFTAIFGHGLLVMCILLYFLKRQRDNDPSKTIVSHLTE